MNQISQRRGIYLLPNLFTTASLFAAFYSIVASMKHFYDTAAIAIFIGMIADSLDGRVARLTNTQSEFGVQYDSLSDMVAFGVAPSLVAYTWSLQYLGKAGWLVAFIYTAAVALRLARFNIQSGDNDMKYFLGLPCPPAAGVVASIIWFSQTLSVDGKSLRIAMSVIMLVLAAKMVSNIRFYSFKEIDFKGKVPFRYILLMVAIFVGIASYPSLVLLVSFGLFVLSGPFFTLRSIKRGKASSDNK